ncbi:hypothetical protein FBEOM_12715 [Fusarium beomiforme]|uniref:Uncharacterized protein n=1 Tax=Fusarium beomiforme TaxID=44412 RepID=A0A9P5DSS7_9HYPO|nr:hypothetical protein FBEOM_12715 [Fusarium beomiforme]
MGDPWKKTIREIARWVVKEHPFMFAHIQGQPAIAKGVKIPLFLLDSLLRQNSNAEILHITNATKKEYVFKAREKLKTNMSPATQMAKAIKTMDYVEATNMLKLSRKENGWNLQDLRPNTCTIIIIEADPDYSAEFALALSAWTVLVSHHSTSESPMRLITMSWEDVHEMTKDFWNGLLCATEPPLREFVLPYIQRNEPRVIHIPEKKLAAQVMNVWVLKNAPNEKHTCISFQGPTGTDESWDDCHQDRHQGLDFATKPRRIHFIRPDFKIAEKMSHEGLTHIITSKSRRRLIFDRQTRQNVTVTIRCSDSEEKQQMSWAHRVTGPKPNIYTQPGFTYGARQRRRMRIKDEQLGGFLIALAEFDKWPVGIGNMAPLLNPPNEETQVVVEIAGRVASQRIIALSDGSSVRWSLLLPEETHAALYAVLPLVEYDHRLAYFLCMKSSNRMANTAKVQMAAIISASSKDCFDFVGHRPPNVRKINETAQIGLLDNVAHTGTIMMGLGLLKAAIGASRFSLILAEIYIADKHIRVNMDEVKHVMERCRIILEALDACGVKVDKDACFTKQEEAIEFDDFMDVWSHLLKAFTYQIAMVSIDNHGRMFMRDLVSHTLLETTFEVRRSLEWQHLPKNNKGYIAGVYTRANRERGRTTIQDWNWIPPQIWDSWEAGLSGGIEGLRTKFKLTGNHDEVADSTF